MRQFSTSFLIKPLVACLLSVSLVSIPAYAEVNNQNVATKIENAGIQSYTFKNGFKVIFSPYPNASDTTVILTVRSGSKVEGYGETGMAHLLEHMLFKSTPSHADIKKSLTDIGAHWNGTTTADRTNYFETFASNPKTLEKVIALEADRLMNASFTKKDLDSEMTVVRNELERNANNPSNVLIESIEQTAWFWHGYGRSTIGETSDIEGAPFEDLRAFYKKHYRPDNAYLVISGKFDVEHAFKLVNRYFGTLKNPKSRPVNTWTKEPAQRGERMVVERIPSGNNMVASAWKVPPAYTDEMVALDLGLSALFHVSSGPVNQDYILKNKKGISFKGETWQQRDGGLALAILTLDKSTEPYQRSKDFSEYIEHLAEEGITQEMLDRVKSEQMNDYRRVVNSSESMGNILAHNEETGDWRLFFSQQDIMRETTLETVNQALKKWILRSNRTSGILISDDNNVAPKVPAFDNTQVEHLVAHKNWKSIVPKADKVVSDLKDLNEIKLITKKPLFELSLMPRKTNGDQVWIKVNRGYGNEESLRGWQTACQFTNMMMSRGGAGMTEAELKDFLEKNQAEAIVDMNSFTVQVSKPYAEVVLTKMFDMWKTPLFDKDIFEKKKSEVLSGFAVLRKNPESLAQLKISEAYADSYPKDHIYSYKNIEESEKAAQDTTLEQVKSCHQKFSGYQNVHIGVTGDYDIDNITNIITRSMGEWKPEVEYKRVNKVYNGRKGDVYKTIVPNKPNTVILGVLNLNIKDSDPDAPALRIATRILGGDANSRIWNSLREKNGLSYTANAQLMFDSYDRSSNMRFYVIANNSNSKKAFDLLQHEIKAILSNGITKEELDKAKRAHFDSRKMSFSEESNYAGIMADNLDAQRDFQFIANFDEDIKRLNVEDVNLALKKWLKPEYIIWSLAGGDK